MLQIDSIPVIRLFRAQHTEFGEPVDGCELEFSCWTSAEDDDAGRESCENNRYAVCTDHTSLSDPPYRFPILKDLQKVLEKQVEAFNMDLEFDHYGGKLELQDIWIDGQPQRGIHTGHIHPHSVISEATQAAPSDASPSTEFEGPLLPMTMAAPARRNGTCLEAGSLAYGAPKSCDVFLWESCLRHEAPLNMAEAERITSVALMAGNDAIKTSRPHCRAFLANGR